MRVVDVRRGAAGGARRFLGLVVGGCEPGRRARPALLHRQGAGHHRRDHGRRSTTTQTVQRPHQTSTRRTHRLIHPVSSSSPPPLLSPSSEIGSSPLNGCEGNCGPAGKQRQPTAGFMTHVTCRLTAKNRDQLLNRTLDNRVWPAITHTHTRVTALFPGLPG